MRIEDILRTRNIKDIVRAAAHTEGSWRRHAIRMDRIKWTNAATIWLPRIENRSVHRQRKRWCVSLSVKWEACGLEQLLKDIRKETL